MKNLEKQINLLRQYWVSNYTVENGKITINGSLYLESLTSIPDSEFLKGTTINGYLHLRSLTSIPDSEFLKGTTINGSLYLGILTSIPDSEFLKGTTINGSLYLRSLTSIPDSEFLKGTTINGDLDLQSLTSIPDSEFLKGTTINGSLYLHSLDSIPDSEFLKGTTINGDLDLQSLTSIPDSEFLKGTTINGSLYLESLTSIPDSEFLKGTTINGSLYLESLTSIPDSEFLKGTTINGSLYLNSLNSLDRRICDSNIKSLTRGYNKENNYCYFDGILTKVLRVSQKKEYTIYTTPIGFVAEKGEFTAHGNTIKKAIQDVEFKVVSEKLKNEPIHPDTLLTVKHYRLITGACDSGCRSFMQANGIEYKVIGNETVETTPIKAKDLLPILEKSNAYGYEKFKSLIIG